MADLDAGDAYLVIGTDAASFGELRGVRGAAADHREVVGVERRVHEQPQNGEAARADRQHAAFAEGLHR
jgi:hypothetical protein